MLGNDLRVLLAASLLLMACSDSETNDPTGGGGSGGGTTETCDGVAEDAIAGCTTVINNSGDDHTTKVQTALIEATSADTICFCPGTYNFEKELSLTVTDVTVKGVGASRDDVVFDFAGQTVGDDGFTVTSDGFAIESLSVKNTPGNGIVVTGAEGVRFSDVHVSWDAGSVVENGAYAVYPVKSKDVIVEDSEIIGAADAGIYVGQCENALVRNNKVHGNVAGIEIENTADSEVVGNEAYDNSAGILVFVLPNLERKEGLRCKVHMNDLHDNNRANFAQAGTIVASVPKGLGLLLLASDLTEIDNNTVSNNVSTGMLLVSYTTLELLTGEPHNDPTTDKYAESTYIHSNTFTNNGTDPDDAIFAAKPAPVEDILWDGEENETTPAGDLCLGTSDLPSFRNFKGVAGITDKMLQTTDTTPHECTGAVQQTIDP